MLSRSKKTYRHTLRKIFYRIKSHSGYIRIMTLPFALRISLAIFLFLFGIIGLLTPIPAGWIMILLACVLVFGLRAVRRYSTGLFFRLRLHRIIEYIWYHWRNKQESIKNRKINLTNLRERESYTVRVILQYLNLNNTISLYS